MWEIGEFQVIDDSWGACASISALLTVLSGPPEVSAYPLPAGMVDAKER